MVNNEIFLLSVLSITTFGTLVILLLYLIIRKSIDIKRKKEIEVYKEKYNMLIFSIVFEGGYSKEITPETSVQLKAIEELLSHYSKVLEGKGEKERLTDLANMYLTYYYKKRLKSKRWSTRMNTLYHIENFNMRKLVENVYMLTERKRISHEELIHELRILALFLYPNMFELLTTKFVHLSEFDFRHILIRLEQKQFELFILHFNKIEPSLKNAILDVIGIKKEVSYLSFVENVFSANSGEIRLRALKALAEIGYAESVDPYLELLNSDKWEERMVSAKLIGALKEERAIPRLVELLHDQIWWVRSQAGKSISQFANGKEILRFVLATSEDDFAKDMAWEWLFKGV